jgi:hypothetical protein
MLALAILADAPRALADSQTNAIQNGNLAQGSGNSPDKWKTAAWQNGPDFTTYHWNHPPNAPAELEVSSAKPNDAYWSQTVHLGPGWYHFTANIRAQGIPTNSSGANISVVEDGITSPHLRGTTDWQPVGFYLKVGDPGADVVLACRLGGFASLNTGKAFCRDLQAVKVDAPPASADAAFKYDLDTIRHPLGMPQKGAAATSSSAGGSSIAVVLELLIAVLVIGFVAWRQFPGKFPTAETFRRIGTAIRHLAPSGAPVSAEYRSDRRIEIALFVLTFFSFAYFYQASDHGTGARFDLMRAIAERRTLWVDGYCGYNTADIVSVGPAGGSHLYSVKAPGGGLTGLPAWVVFANALSPLASRNEALYWALATYLTIVFSTGLMVAILCVVMNRFALFVGAPPGRAVALALILAFATIVCPYATEMTGEPIAAVCGFIAFYLVATDRLRPEAGRLMIAGVLAGWAVLCDFPAVIIAVPLALYALLKTGRRVLPFIAGAVTVGLVLMIHNKIAFGNPFYLSYQAYKMSNLNNQFPEQAVGFVGLTYPRAHLLYKVLIDPERGLFFCTPIMLLTIPALIFFIARRQYRAEFVVSFIAIVGFVLFNASFGESIVSWGGGTATGPRQIVAAIPFMVFALAFLPAAWDYVIAPLALVSAFLMLMATAVEPHLPYEYHDPLRYFVWPAFLRGDLAYNRSSYFGGPPITGDSVAFNLGKLFGLPGPIQLLPLALFWIGGAEYLLRILSERDGSSHRLKSVIAAVLVGALFMPPILGIPIEHSNLKQEHGLLGRYYGGTRPSGYAPHIVRVDRNISFNSIEELGALPYPSFVVWTGKLVAPKTGLYHFDIDVDDAGWLKIDGKSVIEDPGDNPRYHDKGGVYLTAGVHPIEVGERNLVGGSSIRLTWQPPDGQEEIVPDQYLLPH